MRCATARAPSRSRTAASSMTDRRARSRPSCSPPSTPPRARSCLPRSIRPCRSPCTMRGVRMGSSCRSTSLGGWPIPGTRRTLDFVVTTRRAMMRSPFKLAGLTTVGLLCGLSFAPAETPAEINFGVISTEASLNQKKNWEPFVEEMSKAIGIKVKEFYATDYAGVIEAMRFNKVQLAWDGNKAGMEAVDRSNGEVFAQVVSKDGSTGYYSHIIVNAESPYAKLED